MFAYLPERSESYPGNAENDEIHDSDGEDSEASVCVDEADDIIDSDAENNASPTSLPSDEHPLPAPPMVDEIAGAANINGIPSMQSVPYCEVVPNDGTAMPDSLDLPDASLDFQIFQEDSLVLPHDSLERNDTGFVDAEPLGADFGQHCGANAGPGTAPVVEQPSGGQSHPLDSDDILKTDPNFRHHILDNFKIPDHQEDSAALVEIGSSQDCLVEVVQLPFPSFSKKLVHQIRSILGSGHTPS